MPKLDVEAQVSALTRVSRQLTSYGEGKQEGDPEKFILPDENVRAQYVFARDLVNGALRALAQTPEEFAASQPVLDEGLDMTDVFVPPAEEFTAEDSDDDPFDPAEFPPPGPGESYEELHHEE